MRTLYFLLAWFILMVFLSVRGAIEAAQPAPIGIVVALIIPIGLYFIDRRWLGSVIFSGFGSLSRETLVIIQTYRAISGVLASLDRRPRDSGIGSTPRGMDFTI